MLRYSRGKLATTAFMCASSVFLFVALLFGSGKTVGGPVGEILSGDVGFVILLIPIIFLVIGTVRSAGMALGSLDAVAADETMVRITTAWRSHEITWSDLREIRLVKSGSRKRPNYLINFYRYNFPTISLPLGALTLPERQYEAALQQLVSAHREALRTYHGPTSLLTCSEGIFQYLPVGGTTKEAAAQPLLTLMGGISEQFMCASWLNNLEYALWECREANASTQFPGITQRQLDLLRLLSEECDGWWMYSLDYAGTDQPIEFVSLDVWRKHIETTWVHRGGFVTRR